MTVEDHGDHLTVSVIICAYTERRWDDLAAAVDSVRRSDDAGLRSCSW